MFWYLEAVSTPIQIDASRRARSGDPSLRGVLRAVVVRGGAGQAPRRASGARPRPLQWRSTAAAILSRPRETEALGRGTARARPLDSRDRARPRRARARRPAQEPGRAVAPLRAGADVAGARDRMRRRLAGLRPRRRARRDRLVHRLRREPRRDRVAQREPRAAPSQLPLRPRRRTQPAVPPRRRRAAPSQVSFPYADREFDLVCAFGVFMHVERNGIERYLEEIGRVLEVGCPALLELHGGDAARRGAAQRLARVRRGRTGRVHVAARSGRAGRWRTTTR